LDWGAAFTGRPQWWPDGRWIAANSGPDLSDAHLWVISPDGRERHDLASWGCGAFPANNYAWLPDGRLSCIQTHDQPYHMCVGAAPFVTCDALSPPNAFEVDNVGATWTPDGNSLLLAASARRSDGSFENPTNLYVLDSAGRLLQTLPFRDR